MDQYLPYLKWLEHQKEPMKELLIAWANINSHATNYQGLQQQLEQLKKSFGLFKAESGVTISEIELPPYTHINDQGNKEKIALGKALHIKTRPESPIKVLLGGHMDTVYSKNSNFQKVTENHQGTLTGPGVTDMKGGLVILLYALLALEKSPYAKEIGWEVIINPDEEIGSPGSKGLLENSAKSNHIGLLFEPAHADGSLVSQRPGSTNLCIVIRGKAAHAGRDFTKGRSALLAAANLSLAIDRLNTLQADQEITEEDFIVNVGELRSGSGFNVVADVAILRVNIRSRKQETLQDLQKKIEKLTVDHSVKDGIWIELHEISSRGPKNIDSRFEKLAGLFTESSRDLNQTVTFKISHGVSDGNILSRAGLATLDTLGAIGGNIHTHNEYLVVDSLLDRAKAAALFLMRLGAKEIALDPTNNSIQL